MRQLTFRSAGTGAGTEPSLQSASIPEQSRRSIPSGSGGCFVSEGFINHTHCEGVKFSSHSFQRHRYHR
jgi:hypothetical protein